MFTLPTFNVTKYRVEGTKRYQEQEVIDSLGLKPNENIFKQMLFSLNYKSNLAYIAKVDLKFSLPNETIINVSERTSKYFAFDKEKNKFYKVSKDGEILEESNIDSKTKEELLTYGITFNDEVKMGEQINDTDMAKIATYEKISKQYTQSSIKGDITKVSFENSLTTITINDKLNIILPNDTNLKYNMTFLQGIIKNIGESSVGVIDMTKTNPTFSSF
ncbi:MAG: FtsQ-type POTRA domain-containing protein [Clostridia bacterium]